MGIVLRGDKNGKRRVYSVARGSGGEGERERWFKGQNQANPGENFSGETRLGKHPTLNRDPSKLVRRTYSGNERVKCIFFEQASFEQDACS